MLQLLDADPTPASKTGADPTAASKTGADPTPASISGSDPTPASKTGAASGASAGDPKHDWPIWIEKQANVKRENVSWRQMLKSHMQRPKSLGGPICSGHIRDLVKTQQLADDTWEAWLTIPDSWEPGDGAACGAVGKAQNERDAIEAACKDLMIRLIVCDAKENYPASKLRLVPNNWKISPADLLGTIAQDVQGLGCGASGNDESTESRSAAMHAPGRTSQNWAEYKPPAAHEVETRNADIENLLVSISANEVDYGNEEGWARPWCLKQMLMKERGDQFKVRPFVLLQRLVEPRTLLKFLRHRPHMFEVMMHDNKFAFRSKKLDTASASASASASAAASTSASASASAPASASASALASAAPDAQGPPDPSMLAALKACLGAEQRQAEPAAPKGVAQPDTLHLPASESQASQPQPVQPAAQGALLAGNTPEVPSLRRPGRCHCGHCLAEYFLEGWTCHGPQAL